jgi:hypothetical protein
VYLKEFLNVLFGRLLKVRVSLGGFVDDKTNSNLSELFPVMSICFL